MTAKLHGRLKPRMRPPAAHGWDILGFLLDPIDLLAEIIFSLLIILSFTMAYRVFRLGGATAYDFSGAYANSLFWAAFGAAVAWGVIDGFMYALLSLFERGERRRLLQRINAAESDEEGIHAIADELDHILEPITGEENRRALYADALEHLRDSQPKPVGLTRADLTGALGSLLVAVITVLPPLAPLLLFGADPELAIRISNLIAFLMLFIVGWQWGKYSGSNPLRTGLLLAGISAVMILIAIPLGG